MVLVVAPLLALGGCQKADVGQPCTITWGSDPELGLPRPDPVQLYESGGADFFESGNIECENLVCIVLAGPGGCALRFGRVLLEAVRLERGLLRVGHRARLPADGARPGLPRAAQSARPGPAGSATSADVQFSSYCAVPR